MPLRDRINCLAKNIIVNARVPNPLITLGAPTAKQNRIRTDPGIPLDPDQVINISDPDPNSHPIYKH